MSLLITNPHPSDDLVFTSNDGTVVTITHGGGTETLDEAALTAAGFYGARWWTSLLRAPLLPLTTMLVAQFCAAIVVIGFVIATM